MCVSSSSRRGLATLPDPVTKRTGLGWTRIVCIRLELSHEIAVAVTEPVEQQAAGGIATLGLRLQSADNCIRHHAGQTIALSDMTKRQSDQQRRIVSGRIMTSRSGIAEDGAMRMMAGRV